MRTRMYGGVRGRKTKVGGKPTFVFLLLDFLDADMAFCHRTALAPEEGRGPLCGKDRQWQNAISTLYILRSHLWEEEYILDSRGVGHEHSKTVDSHTES